MYVTNLVVARKISNKGLLRKLLLQFSETGICGLDVGALEAQKELHLLDIEQNDLLVELFDPTHSPDAGLFMDHDNVFSQNSTTKPWKPLDERLVIAKDLIGLCLKHSECVEFYVTEGPANPSSEKTYAICFDEFLDTMRHMYRKNNVLPFIHLVIRA